MTPSGYFFRHNCNHGILQFSSVAQSCPTLCSPMDYSTPGLPVLRHLHLWGTETLYCLNVFKPTSPLKCLTLQLWPSCKTVSQWCYLYSTYGRLSIFSGWQWPWHTLSPNIFHTLVCLQVWPDTQCCHWTEGFWFQIWTNKIEAEMQRYLVRVQVSIVIRWT